MKASTASTIPCTHCSFSQFCLPGSAQQPLNLAVKQHYHLKKKETLYLQKSTFRHLYAIQEGAIKTYQVDPEGHEYIRGFYFKGEVFGFEAICANQYISSAVALVDTVVCEISYENLLVLLQQKQPLQHRLIQLMSQQLNMGSYSNAFSAKQRFAGFLIDLSNRVPASVGGDMLLPMSQQDIGHYLNLTTETINRLFSHFQKQKLLHFKNKKIRFLEKESLRNIATGASINEHSTL